MELKTFIATTLKEIAEGVNEAKATYTELGGCVNPKTYIDVQGDIGCVHMGYETYRIPLSVVHFDVLLSDSASSGSKAGVGVLLSVIRAGGEGSKENTILQSSSVKFIVPVVLP